MASLNSSGTGINQLVPMVAFYGRGNVVKECSRRGMSMGDWWRRGCVGCDDEGVWRRSSRVVMLMRSKWVGGGGSRSNSSEVVGGEDDGRRY